MDNIDFMKEALKEAKKALKKEEVPIGAVIVKNNEIIARAHNLRETKNQATAHAEILVIEKACKKLNTWRLENCDMYVTLEPCAMCAGAIINSRINKIYIGADEPKSGAAGSVINTFEDYKFNYHVLVQRGILEEESRNLLQDFFKYLRNKKKNIKNKE